MIKSDKRHEFLSRIENDIHENGFATAAVFEMKEVFTVNSALYDPSPLWSAHYLEFDERREVYFIYPKRPSLD